MKAKRLRRIRIMINKRMSSIKQTIIVKTVNVEIRFINALVKVS